MKDKEIYRRYSEAFKRQVVAQYERGASIAALDRLRELWRQCLKSAHRVSPETEEQEQYIVNMTHCLRIARFFNLC